MQTTNNHKFICIPCRYSARRPWSDEWKPRCPHCQKSLLHVGLKIPIPRKNDDKAWAALALNPKTRLRTRGTKKVLVGSPI